MARGVTVNLPGLIVAIGGGLVSIALLLAAARNTPTVLLILLIGWVALPFVDLHAQTKAVKRKKVMGRAVAGRIPALQYRCHRF